TAPLRTKIAPYYYVKLQSVKWDMAPPHIKPLPEWEEAERIAGWELETSGDRLPRIILSRFLSRKQE
ncbi:MAG: hypothetical protein ABI324_24965, partial [Ktedonobacteraceae bacterium]